MRFFAFELDKLALLLFCSGGQGFIYIAVKSLKCDIFQFRSQLERLNYIKLHFVAMNIILWIFAFFVSFQVRYLSLPLLIHHLIALCNGSNSI